MSKNRLTTAWVCTLLGAVVVAFLALLAGAGAAQEAVPLASAKTPGVAVVDMAKMLRESQHWRDLTQERTRLRDNMRRTLEKLSRQALTLLNKYENLPPGTEERKEKALAVDQAQVELQQAAQQFQQKIAKQYDESYRTIFSEVSDAVSGYAQEHGIDLVLKKQSLQLTGPESIEQNLLIATTEVLYTNPGLDITDAVIERLNAAYAGPIQVK